MSPVTALTIVGAGPAGASAALGARAADPSLEVTLLDRADFPRDKSCGDGVAPHVLDLLEGVGVTGLLDDREPVTTLSLTRGGRGVERLMARPAYVVPRTVLDARLVEAAQAAGATLVRHRVRDLAELDEAAVVVGADGAHSVLRKALGQPQGATALAIRGYAPTPAGHEGTQRIVFGGADGADGRGGPQPTYAWSFDRGDGLANVGYGELLRDGHRAPTKARLLARLEELLPGSTAGGTDWVGHHLPLSTAHWHPADGRVLLVGDAAGLVNPMTGEGIFYAVATGLAAGRAAAEAIAAGDPASAGRRYARATRPILARHLRHTALASRLCRSGRVLDAGLRASARDQRVFDDLVELGLARGRITPSLARALATSYLAPTR
ncbi:NAD(P)/FAD-dependent oxidoreductase [Nocardioides rubriscoriae]|uniref:NAD(P)/FAD-dependent oxidoreductase n=1 Tax=Nocardioides rubriscoriae TaxID=642762 RepID=UPI0011DFC491|nr:FAD-dependent monooxygenase [Nocardioides rubriscoriae]